MTAYVIRRLLLMIPTLIGIMIINFVIIQFAPGGPIEQTIGRLQGIDIRATARITGGGAGEVGQAGDQVVVENEADAAIRARYRGAQGLDAEFISQLEIQYGFDKPIVERFFLMMGNYLRFDFGESHFRKISVIDLILEKMPVSISLGIWMTLLSYAISIPLGIRKAVRDGSRFDIVTSNIVIIGNAIPGFLFAILMIVLFAGGNFLDIFPLRGLTSSNFAELSLIGKIGDYFWHLALPIIAMAIGAFATSTLFVRNVFLDEIRKQYVITARAKGLTERRVLYGHVFRNAMLLVIAGFPGAFLGAFFAGSLLIETIFSLDGLGLLGFESAINRDYPVLFATLYIFSIIGLVMGLITDLVYTWVDPRIDFETRQV